jgi:hypothetical protein
MVSKKLGCEKEELSLWLHGVNNHLCIILMTLLQLKKSENRGVNPKTLEVLTKHCNDVVELNRDFVMKLNTNG